MFNQFGKINYNSWFQSNDNNVSFFGIYTLEINLKNFVFALSSIYFKTTYAGFFAMVQLQKKSCSIKNNGVGEGRGDEGSLGQFSLFEPIKFNFLENISNTDTNLSFYLLSIYCM